MTDRTPDPLEVADQIDRMMTAVPEDGEDEVDRMTRARLTGYAQGLRDGVDGIPSP
ncbi:MAG: hypothetical protein ACTMH5_07645 [Brachybacterium sp.]|uniref:hypothetical protein n=1 Tax=Brachybacterium sp. TaxID=1891286 RepID=UPI003F90272E